jgi:hypothetical protein
MVDTADHVVLAGTYRFPVPLGVTTGCLGKSFEVVVGGMTGRARLPSYAWDQHSPRLVGPTLGIPLDDVITRFVERQEDVATRPDFWGFISGWHPAKRKLTAIGVSAALLDFSVPSEEIGYSDYLYGRGHPQGAPLDALFRDVDTWFDTLRTWIEVAVDQDADPANPMSTVSQPGSGLMLASEDNGTLSIPATAHEIHVAMSQEEPINLPRLRKAIKQTNAGAQPSDAHLLVRDARAALRRQSYRRSVIDAGGAVEMTLAEHNRATVHVSPGGRLPTLGWYVRRPPIIAATGLAESALVADLVNPRNNAIHQSIVPTRVDTVRAIAISQRVLAALDPLLV